MFHKEAYFKQIGNGFDLGENALICWSIYEQADAFVTI